MIRRLTIYVMDTWSPPVSCSRWLYGVSRRRNANACGRHDRWNPRASRRMGLWHM